MTTKESPSPGKVPAASGGNSEWEKSLEDAEQRGARPKQMGGGGRLLEELWFPLPEEEKKRRRAGRVTAWDQAVGEAMLRAPREENLADEVAGLKEDLRELKSLMSQLTTRESEQRENHSTPKPATDAFGEGSEEESDEEAETTLSPHSRRGGLNTGPRRGRGETEALRELLASKLEAKFNGDPEQLPFFLAQVAGHMRTRGDYFPDQGEKVCCVAGRLEGQAAQWLVQLYDCRAPELQNLGAFMTALRARFEDPFRVDRAKTKFMTLQQGKRSVGEYVLEFRSVAAQIPDFPEPMLVRQFQDGLNSELLEWVLMRGNPEGLQEWMRWAGEAETTKERVRLAKHRAALQQGKAMVKPSGGGAQQHPKAMRESEKQRRMRLGLCLACGMKGHLIAKCPERAGDKATGKAPPSSGGGARRETAGQVTHPGTGAPRFEAHQKDADQDGNIPTVVSGGVPIYFLEVKLGHKRKGTMGTLLAALDSGCTRCLMSPKTVQEWGINQEPLPEEIPFMQMDGSIMGGGVPSRTQTELLTLKIAGHQEPIQFVIGATQGWDLVLGIDWLAQHNPAINWRNMRLTFNDPGCKQHLRLKGHSSAEDSQALTIKMRGPCAMSAGTGARPPLGFPEVYRDLGEVFEEKECDVLPPHRDTDCAIELNPGVAPPKPKMYPMTPREMSTLKEFIEKNLARGFIRPSSSPFGAPVFFREKKDGTLRLVTDYKNLNAISTCSRYPLPLMKDMLSWLSTGKIFTKLDLRDAYFRVRIKEGDEYKTAFHCPLGAFEYLVLPFGLSGGPSCFMKLVHEVLHDLLFEGVLVYLDDILIYSQDLNSHVQLVRKVLKRLLDHKLYVKLSKCHFHTDALDFLGYRVSTQGLHMDPHKVQDVLNWPEPKTRKQVQRFLGFANFYRQFIPDFAQVALPITNLLKTSEGEGRKQRGQTPMGTEKPKPSNKINWTPECTKAFEALKQLFSSESILKHPDPEQPFVVQVDASDAAVGAVLLQRDEGGQLRPCAYSSKKFDSTQANWPCWERESFAIKWALDIWRQFLEGAPHPFEVWTDHRNLEALQTLRQLLSPKQRRWAKDFFKFNFTIKFIPGRENGLADGLSRMHGPGEKEELEKQTLFTAQQLGLGVTTRSQTKREQERAVADLDPLLREILQAYEGDLELNKLKSELQQTEHGLWGKDNKIYVPENLRAK
ncbi:uncharacterized protein LOC121917880, partial [Sceloporus undulatus]|uniref:uncharacterized protein LOC121917880 n=1 Tax=Sceloporus undulatus TaxID=8520 RepID=UPI001C4C71E1